MAAVLSGEDNSAQQKEELFLASGCGCVKNCLADFDSQEVLAVRDTFLELPAVERNQLILFAIQSFCQTPETVRETAVTKGQAAKTRQRTHSSAASREREVYKAQCESSKEAVKKMVKEGVQPGQANSNSNDINIHYSVDYIQNVLLPSNAQQPSQLYFKTGCKVHLFVACNEGRPHGYLNTMDEAQWTGKGADECCMITSTLSIMERKPCTVMRTIVGGRTKTMLLFITYCGDVLLDFNTTITCAFMLVGHTRFAPDWLAGLFKSKFKRADVQCLDDVAEVIRKSSATAKVLQLRLVCATASPVHTYHWQEHLKQFFRPLPAIRNNHHFRFESSEPGVVYMETGSNEPEERFCLLKTVLQNMTRALPRVKPPADLSLERQQYL